MRRPALAFLVLCVLLVAGCASPGAPPVAVEACGAPAPAPEDGWRAEKPRARLVTSLGNVTVELDREQAPLTVGNFLNLSESGFYEGVLFHRVVRQFIIQSGDPLTRDDDPRNDGTGGPGYDIPDEFNAELRHTGAGVLSMANAGPDSGGSQFFITLGATPHLDDRHAVFGRVVEGMDVVQAIGRVQVDTQDRPLEPVVLERVEVLEAREEEARHAVAVHVVIPEKTTAASRDVTFAVVLENEGNVRDAIALTADAPAGWSCRVSAPEPVPAGSGRVVFLTLTPPAGAEGSHSVTVRADSSWSEAPEASAQARVVLGKLGAAIRDGDTVRVNYAGLLPTGRLFDTSLESVARNAELPKFNSTGGFSMRGAYSPFSFIVGPDCGQMCVVEGFSELARTARVGETVTMLLPQEKAYPAGSASVYERPLTGRALVFEMQVLEKQ